MNDPHDPRGKRHPLVTVLGTAVIATLAGAKNFREIGDHAADVPTDLLWLLGARWCTAGNRFLAPSAGTIRRVLVDIDAAHTQTETARHIVEDKNADYLLTIKGNQPNLMRAAVAACNAHGLRELVYVTDTATGHTADMSTQVIDAMLALKNLADTAHSTGASIDLASRDHHAHVLRSAVLLGIDVTAARSSELQRKHHALFIRLRDRRDDYLRFLDDPHIPWYNHHRLMHRLGRIPPAEAEARYYAQNVTSQPAGSQKPEGA